jgi:PAS domain S-box-containing protein
MTVRFCETLALQSTTDMVKVFGCRPSGASLGLLRSQAGDAGRTVGAAGAAGPGRAVLDGAVRALSAVREGAGCGACRDVRAGRLDAQGEGDHRGVVRITFCNTALFRLLGYEPSDLLGRPQSDIMSPSWMEIAAKEIGCKPAGRRGSLSPKRPIATSYITKAGKLVPATIHCEAIRDDGGRIMGYIAIVTLDAIAGVGAAPTTI